MVALLKEDSLPKRRTEPMPSLAPRLRLVPTDQSPLRLDLETPADISQLFDQRRDTTAGRTSKQKGLIVERPIVERPIVERRVVEAPVADLTEEALDAEYRPVISPAFAIVTALLILALLSFVRISQGAPPASSWDSLAPTPAVATAPGVGETVRIVDVGDTLWAIAAEIAPDVDRRIAVDSLAKRNGGSGLQVGQRLVIPVELATS